jgi:hypothetical protein
MRRVLFFTCLMGAMAGAGAQAADMGRFPDQSMTVYHGRVPVPRAELIVIADPLYTPGNPRCYLKREPAVLEGRLVVIYRPICG